MLERRGSEESMGAHLVSSREVCVSAAGLPLAATLSWPSPCQGVIVFSHGSGSSRFSPRNRSVAASLQEAGWATLLLDLLTPEEAQVDADTRRWRFDIPLLAQRLTGAVDWLSDERRVAREALPALPLGLFGASTGAAAALITAAPRPTAVGAIVCRGGRPDLAPVALPSVRCPTLFIVGAADPEVLALNQRALAAMTAPHHLAVVPGASHLFAEPGALEAVCVLTRECFAHSLSPANAHPASPSP
ncbi:MAG: dienelactone hydrolase family protein [Cyanobacteriota bacterium]|nr:dienelactone hydrolase family protein [Cyanobacteriota bacterium]